MGYPVPPMPMHAMNGRGRGRRCLGKSELHLQLGKKQERAAEAGRLFSGLDSPNFVSLALFLGAIDAVFLGSCGQLMSYA